MSVHALTCVRARVRAGHESRCPTGCRPQDPSCHHQHELRALLVCRVPRILACAVLQRLLMIMPSSPRASDTYNPCPGVQPNVPASRGYTGGFGSALMAKDLGLALDAAKTVGAWQQRPEGGCICTHCLALPQALRYRRVALPMQFISSCLLRVSLTKTSPRCTPFCMEQAQRRTLVRAVQALRPFNPQAGRQSDLRLIRPDTLRCCRWNGVGHSTALSCWGGDSDPALPPHWLRPPGFRHPIARRAAHVP